jgi:hypothetical protein
MNDQTYNTCDGKQWNDRLGFIVKIRALAKLKKKFKIRKTNIKIYN